MSQTFTEFTPVPSRNKWTGSNFKESTDPYISLYYLIFVTTFLNVQVRVLHRTTICFLHTVTRRFVVKQSWAAFNFNLNSNAKHRKRSAYYANLTNILWQSCSVKPWFCTDFKTNSWSKLNQTWPETFKELLINVGSHPVMPACTSLDINKRSCLENLY